MSDRNGERNPFLIVVGGSASPNLELNLTRFVTIGQIDALVVAAEPFNGTVTVDRELLVLAARVTFPDLEFGAVFVFAIDNIETRFSANLNRGGRTGSGIGATLGKYPSLLSDVDRARLNVYCCTIGDGAFDSNARTCVILELVMVVVDLELDRLVDGCCGPWNDVVGVPFLRSDICVAGVDHGVTNPVSEIEIKTFGVILLPGDRTISIDVPLLIGVTRVAGVRLYGVANGVLAILNVQAKVTVNNYGTGGAGT